MKLTKEKFDVTTKDVEAQDVEIKELTETTKTKQKDVDDRLKVVEEARKVKNFEQEKNNKFNKKLWKNP